MSTKAAAKQREGVVNEMIRIHKQQEAEVPYHTSEIPQLVGQTSAPINVPTNHLKGERILDRMPRIVRD